ncbi:hypothetical protein [Cyclobacterium jeungdonense]|uniref:Uncharacterized protein n=1 Tax=Cyclobacterium jeungdonense TaxID=708087 RepID=A0ABT8C513_9BACT|nr:hypothetical protein [Cyclobacterium jeungdonense]MDN3687396.1 hypothetical protein [Cyclobacterium jeungdonense]
MKELLARLRNITLRLREIISISRDRNTESIYNELDQIQREIYDLELIEPSLNSLEKFKRRNMIISGFPTVVALGLVVYVFFLNEANTTQKRTFQNNASIRKEIIEKLETINEETMYQLTLDTVMNDSTIISLLGRRYYDDENSNYENGKRFLFMEYLRAKNFKNKMILEIDSLKKELVKTKAANLVARPEPNGSG